MMPPISARPTNALHSSRLTAVCSRPAIRSTTIKPRLCRGRSYSGPGFPSPAISHFVSDDLSIDRIDPANGRTELSPPAAADQMLFAAFFGGSIAFGRSFAFFAFGFANDFRFRIFFDLRFEFLFLDQNDRSNDRFRRF